MYVLISYVCMCACIRIRMPCFAQILVGARVLLFMCVRMYVCMYVCIIV